MALLIREEEVRDLLTMAEASAVVEEAFRQLGQGKAFNNPRTRVKLGGEILHVLPAALPEMDALGLKSYTAFRGGIRFLVLLYSASTGELKALVQAQRLGELRTAAVAAVAIKYMAREDSTRGAVFGTGNIGRAMLEAMVNVRQFQQIKVLNTRLERLPAYCAEMSERLGVDVVPGTDAADAIRDADVVVTCTTARDPVFDGRQLRPGTTVVAAGSNLLQKREIDSTVVRRAARIVVDAVDQAQLEAGDLFQPIDSGHLHWSQVHELSEVLLGKLAGREAADEINLFKSVGLGVQDMALAASVYEAAARAGVGMPIAL
ncbi:MAG: ornithine cyclodeaminase family protein [Chloroflexi bacterium]|nr:ornithine cyclodeaminase family protein [Chloroflexota bacterium]